MNTESSPTATRHARVVVIVDEHFVFNDVYSGLLLSSNLASRVLSSQFTLNQYLNESRKHQNLLLEDKMTDNIEGLHVVTAEAKGASYPNPFTKRH